MNIKNDKLIELAKKYGTPLYVYDGDFIRRQYKSLFEFIKWPKLKIYYAMKANFNVEILKLLEQEGSYLDTVSPAEVILAKKLGFSPDRLLYTANNMTDDEIKQVYDLGVLMNFESLTHLEKFGKMYPGSNVCVRLNPNVVAGYFDKIKTGGDLTKFGILLEEVPKILKIVKKYSLKVVGLHEHTGSGINDSESVLQSMKNILDVATKENFPDLDFIDFGGGFGVAYKPNDRQIHYETFGKKIAEIFSEFCKKYGKEIQMYFEPGKYIVAESGSMVVQVNNVKDNKGTRIAGVNAGFPDLIRPMFYGAYHPIRNLTNSEGEKKKFDIVGNICETGDRFAEQRDLPDVRLGDFLSIDIAGAYCYSMGGFYNLRPMPGEVIIVDGKDKLVRKMLDNEQLVNNILEECEK
jgi:diaminopimelate decarboxylase